MHSDKTCSTCNCSHTGEQNNMACRARSPQLSFVLMPQRTLQGDQIVPVPIAGWPPVRPDQYCHEWQPKRPLLVQ